MPPGLERVVRRCLEKDPGERFQSAHDLGLALETLSGPAPPALARSDAAGSRALALAALAVLAVAAAAAWLLRGRGPESARPRPAHRPLDRRRRVEAHAPAVPGRREGRLQLERTRPGQLAPLRQGPGPGNAADPVDRHMPATSARPGRPTAGRSPSFVGLETGRRDLHRALARGPGAPADRRAGPVRLPDGTFIRSCPGLRTASGWLFPRSLATTSPPASSACRSRRSRRRRSRSLRPARSATCAPSCRPTAGPSPSSGRPRARGAPGTCGCSRSDRAQARQLTFGKYDPCCGLAWTPDAKEVVFSTSNGGRRPDPPCARHGRDAGAARRHRKRRRLALRAWRAAWSTSSSTPCDLGCLEDPGPKVHGRRSEAGDAHRLAVERRSCRPTPRTAAGSPSTRIGAALERLGLRRGRCQPRSAHGVRRLDRRLGGPLVPGRSEDRLHLGRSRQPQTSTSSTPRAGRRGA